MIHVYGPQMTTMHYYARPNEGCHSCILYLKIRFVPLRHNVHATPNYVLVVSVQLTVLLVCWLAQFGECVQFKDCRGR